MMVCNFGENKSREFEVVNAHSAKTPGMSAIGNERGRAAVCQTEPWMSSSVCEITFAQTYNRLDAVLIG